VALTETLVTVTTWNGTLPNPIAKGDLLIITAQGPDLGSNWTVTDNSAGGPLAWHKDTSQDWNTIGCSQAIYHVVAPAALASLTVTLTRNLAGQTYATLGLWDYQHQGTLGFDVGSGGTAGSGTAASCGALSLAGTDELVVAHCGSFASGPTFTAGAGFTLRGQSNNPAGISFGVADARGISGSITPAMTISASASWGMIAGSFLMTSSGASPGVWLGDSVSPYPARRHVIPCNPLDVREYLCPSRHRRTRRR
jgi:hypothetical protein